MAIAHRGQAKRLVIARIFLIADANKSSLQKLHNGGQDLVSLEAGELQVAIDAFSDFRQGLPEQSHLLVLVLVADLPPPFVITILFPATGVAACRLEMTIGYRADPDIHVSGRNRQAFDSQKTLLVFDWFTVEIEIFELVTLRFSGVTGAIVGDVAQAGFLGSLDWITYNLGSFPLFARRFLSDRRHARKKLTILKNRSSC